MIRELDSFTPAPSGTFWALPPTNAPVLHQPNERIVLPVPVDPNVRAQDVEHLTAQCVEVLARLRAGPLTTCGAIEMGCLRLAARIRDLRAAGYTFSSRRVGRIAEYTLTGEPK